VGSEVRRGEMPDAVPAHEVLVDPGMVRTVGHSFVGDADDRPMAEVPQMLQGQLRSPGFVSVEAGTAPRTHPIAHADDVLVTSGEVVEGGVAAGDVAQEEDPVGV